MLAEMRIMAAEQRLELLVAHRCDERLELYE